MKKLVQEKNEAIRLRRLGYSYQDIIRHIPVAKSSLSLWLNGIILTQDELELLGKRIVEQKKNGRLKSGLVNSLRKSEREKRVSEVAKREFHENIRNKLFFVGIALYWAEGAKKSDRFQFINSDPDMIILMVKWIEKFLKVPRNDLKYRLFIRRPYEHERCEEFWGKIIQVPHQKFQKTIFKPTPHTVKRNPIYKGCLRIDIGGIYTLRKMIAWQKLLIKYYMTVK